MATITAVREGDVFRFSYSEATRKKNPGWDYHWCFDGQLVADDRGRLRDTYWSSGGSDGKSWESREAAERDGTLTFVCNMKDVDVMEEWQTRRFSPEDVFDLTQHHGYRKKFAVRKGAQPNQALMLERIDEHIAKRLEDAESAARSAKFDAEWWTKEREKVANSDLSIGLSWRE